MSHPKSCPLVASSCQSPCLALDNIILGGRWTLRAGASFGLPTCHSVSKLHGKSEQIGQNTLGDFVIEPSSCGIFSISKFHFVTALGSKPPSLLAQSQWSPNPSEQARSPWFQRTEAFAALCIRRAETAEPSTPDTKWEMCSMYATCKTLFHAVSSCDMMYYTQHVSHKIGYGLMVMGDINLQHQVGGFSQPGSSTYQGWVVPAKLECFWSPLLRDDTDLFTPQWGNLERGAKVSVVVDSLVHTTESLLVTTVPDARQVNVVGAIDQRVWGCHRLTLFDVIFDKVGPVVELLLTDQSVVIAYGLRPAEDLLRCVELCSGIACSSLGLAAAGFRHVCCVEWRAPFVDLQSACHPGIPVILGDIAGPSCLKEVAQLVDPPFTMTSLFRWVSGWPKWWSI